MDRLIEKSARLNENIQYLQRFFSYFMYLSLQIPEEPQILLIYIYVWRKQQC